MEALEVTTHWFYILTPGALFNEHATSIPKKIYDTVFLLFAHKYVLQAEADIPLTKVGKEKRKRTAMKEAKEAELARLKLHYAAKKAKALGAHDQVPGPPLPSLAEPANFPAVIERMMDIDIRPLPIYQIRDPVFKNSRLCYGSNILHSI